MSEKDYQKKTAAQWRGQWLRSLVPLANNLCELPAGTLFRVRDKLGGFHVESAKCKGCGIEVYIRYVRPEQVEHVLPPTA